MNETLGTTLVFILVFIVVPWGLILSAMTVIVMVVTNWSGRSLVYRHRVGVSSHE